MVTSTSFKLKLTEDKIAVITMDIPGENQNTLRTEFATEINALLDELESKAPSGIILTSGKKDSFIVGADINMLKGLQSKEEILAVTSAGYDVFNRIEKLSIPVIAEIHGACMGGGLELALACHGRVCSNHSATILALPEVQLGILPGGGGTQRLPALIGITEALGMMTTGRNIRADKAVKMGLVDDVTEQQNLREASLKRIKQLKQTSSKSDGFDIKQLMSVKGLQELVLEKNQIGLNFLFQQARKKVNAKTRGNYPAPEKIIDCVEAYASGNSKKGYETEAINFAELVLSAEAKQLINLFFAITELKKDRFIDTKPRLKPIQQLGVIGGGLMGAGIALVSAEKTEATIRIKDMNEEGINHALKYIWKRLQAKVKKRHYNKQQANAKMANVTACTDYSGFSNADLVIEAVFESIELKHQIVHEVEKHCRRNTIFATNTSSIPVTEIAAVAKRPENIIGMHYFSPVEKMPLLELVITDKTSDKTIATAVDFGRKQGKTVIVVNDGAGFYTSRVLGAYMNEAGHILSEGVPIEDIDAALEDFGYPVGPITLLDEVGIDVATKITPILQQAFGERMKPAKAFSKLIEAGRLGKKNNKGFYDYTSKSKGKRPVDESVYSDIGVKPDQKLPASAIVQRCNLALVNEAVCCLDEGILKSPRDGDIGAIFGLGFPPYLGGPFRYIDEIGSEKIIHLLDKYQQNNNLRFVPADGLVKMARNGKNFY